MAVMDPAMLEGVLPVTRLRMAELTEGWRNWTLSGAATLKLFQLTMARLEFCWMVSRVLLGWVMTTLPAWTWAPWGRARAGGVMAPSPNNTRALRAVRLGVGITAGDRDDGYETIT